MVAKRTNTEININERMAKIQVLSALVARNNIAMRLGMSFDGDRDLYTALGYPLTVKYEEYVSRYIRQDMAKAIIDRPAKATWQGPLLLQESKKAEKTKLEIAWNDLEKKLGLKSKFSRVDRLAGLGHYGILLLGLNDVKSPEDWSKPVTVGTRKLLYVKPYGEGTATIEKYVEKTDDPRYGLPEMYRINVEQTNRTNTTKVFTPVNVHYTRVIHVIDDVLEDDSIGFPRLEVVYNRLMDLEKIIGGDAEMFWKGARPGYQGNVDKDYQLTPQMREDLSNQLDEYEHNLRRILVNEGISYKALEQQIADPSNHVDMQIQMISSVTGIPKRILTGTERGELSSAQDASEWKSYVNGRRLDHAEPHIVRPFVDTCIAYGILPKPETDEYNVVWSDLYALSESDAVKIGLDRSTALRNYTMSPVSETIVSPEAFLEYFLGFDEHQLEIVKKNADSEIMKEQKFLLEMITPEEKTEEPTENNPDKGEASPNTKKAKRKAKNDQE